MKYRAVTAVLVVGCLTAACGSDNATDTAPTDVTESDGSVETSDETEPAESTASVDGEVTEDGGSLVAEAEAAALAAAVGVEGGSVTVLGVLGGEELADIESVFAPFESATGIEVQYEGTRDFGAVLQTRVDGGNPPDVVMTPAVGEISALAADGKAVDLRTVIDEDVLSSSYTPALIEAGSNGDEVFGIYQTGTVGGLIWYNPNTYTGPTDPATWDELVAWADEQAVAGETPWCVGLESGAASGWPAADFIDEILLRQAGPQFHRSWAEGEQPWNAPEIEAAFETYGQTAGEGLAFGGVTNVVSTPFDQAANPMFTDPPGCSILQQASFMGGIILDANPDLIPGEDLDFFAVPDFSSEYSNIRSFFGEIAAITNETPQSAALLRYLADPASAALIANTGRWLAPNSQVDPSIYVDPFVAKASDIVVSAAGTYGLGNSQMPQETVDAFWLAGVEYTQEPERLAEILEEIEATRS